MLKDDDPADDVEAAKEDAATAAPTTASNLVVQHARSLARFVAASVGAGSDADSLTLEVIVASVAAANEGDAEALTRARLFGLARKRVALHVEHWRRRTATSGEPRGEGPRALIAGVRPTEREALLLRYVADLPILDVALASGTDEPIARQRISRALCQLCAVERGGSVANEAADVAAMRRRVEDRLADVLDGLAPDDVADFVADDDQARDLVHDAERMVEIVRGLGADHAADLSALSRSVEASLQGVPAREESPSKATEAIHEEEPSTKPPVSEEALAPAATGLEDEARATPPVDRQPLVERLGARGRLAVVVGAVAFLAVVMFLVSRSGNRHAAGDAWSGKVERLALAFGTSGGLQRCSPDRAVCSPVAAGDEVPAGSTLRTDGGTRAVVLLADGTRVSLDRDSALQLEGDLPRRARLDHGALVLDVPEFGDARARIDLPLGFVETEVSKFSVSVAPRRIAVEVVRGRARLFDAVERGVAVQGGETGRLEPGKPPDVESTAHLGSGLGWSERGFGGEVEEITGLGELRAKKVGEDREQKGAVSLASHSTKTRIVGNVARTEIEEEFSNATSDVLEGIFRFPLPADAQIERLALDVDGKMVDGAFVDRDRAAAIWRGAIVNAGEKRKPEEEIVWVPGPWRDPALLEWQRGGRFELRVYPIPKQGSRHVLLAYTQVIPPEGDVRRYVYPLPFDPSGSTRVGRFDLDVQVRGHDPKTGVLTQGYAVRQERLSDGAESFSFHAEGFSPRGDLSVEFALPESEREVTAWAYQPGPDDAQSGASVSASPNDAYVALALRPKLPLVTDGVRRSFAIVVDSSRSMFGERYRRAAELASRMVREMNRDDVATVLACDSTCREIPSGPAPGGPESASAVSEFLGHVTPEGGSDIAGAISRARDSLRSAAQGTARIVYIGDGTPTIGPVQPAFVRREIQAKADGGSVTAVAIGSDADVGTLRTIADAGGGVVIPYVPGQNVEETAYAVLGATYGSALSDVELEWPDGLVDVSPRRLGTIPAGGEVIVTGRLTRPVLDGAFHLRGKVGGVPFEQRYPVRVLATTAKGNAFVPRLWAAATIADLEKGSDAESRKRAVELSAQFHVASRYTSLLVLESAAMFQAFGLDRSRTGPTWTGEDEATSTGSDSELAAADEKRPLELSDKAGAPAPSPSDPNRGALDSFGEIGAGSSVSEGRAKSAAATAGAAPATAAPAKKAELPAPSAYENEAPRGYAPSPPLQVRRDVEPDEPFEQPTPTRARRFIPMRKVWDRVGRIVASPVLPSMVTEEAFAAAERDAASGDHRDAVKRLYTLSLLRGDLNRASAVAERWSSKDPLDPDALTARADIAAARGDRELAIRILGSVVDVRPGDHKAQWRLARLHRWAGRAELGCRHSLAVAQIRPNDAKLITEFVRCARDAGEISLANDVLAAADTPTRAASDLLLVVPEVDPSALIGDLQAEATWSGGDDLDLAFLPTDGYRISWLGAPTRAIITARDALSTSREGLALNGAGPGDYVVEITRTGGHTGVIRGSVDVRAAGERRTVPFVLEGSSVRVALVKITTKSRLVPL